jgi:hypothetical protein
VSVQTGVPVVQESVPVWQGLVGVQELPALQVTQPPPMQTRLLPQGVPLGRLAVSAQTELPVPQDVAPILHTLPG